MFLMRIVYCSRVSDRFQPEDIDKILASARKHNEKMHVTGVLCFNRKYFLQCLEGGRRSINTIYHQILNDSRHSEIIMLSYKEIGCRQFENWQMAYIPEKHLTDKINMKYSGNPDFDPFTMSGDSSYELLLELSKNLLTV